MILLIHPPVVKPSEPPASLAYLSGALAAHGVAHRSLDLALESTLWLAERAGALTGLASTRDRRAVAHARASLSALREPATYTSPGRYTRAVADLNRAVWLAGRAINPGADVGLADFSMDTLSPLKSADLLRAAGHPALDPFHAYFAPRLVATFREAEPALVGISLNYLSQALTAFAIAGWIREHAPGVRIAMGGGLVTSWLRGGHWRDGLFAGVVDEFIAGPGEAWLLTQAGRVSTGLRSVPVFADDPASYLSPGAVVPVAGSTGCWWAKCSFCPERAEGSAYTQIPPDAFGPHVDEAIRAGGGNPAMLHLLDNAVSPAHLRVMSARPEPIPWYGFARVTSELGDDEHCRTLRRSGCVMLKLGIESGSQRVLDAMDKGIALSEVSAALRALRRAGIATYVYLLFGTPEEREADAEATLRFAVAHAPEITFMNLAVFNLPVAGQEAGALLTSPMGEGDLPLYAAFEHPHGWGRAEVREFLDRRFRRHPALAPIAARTPSVFTSNHAPFLSPHYIDPGE